jgi:hypothetical protein
MSELVSAQSVRAFYRDLWASVHDAPAPDFLADGEPLPPFLCRSLAFDDPSFPADCSWAAAMTGSPDGVVRRIGQGQARLQWGVSGISPSLHDYIPIAGHVLVGYSDVRNRLLREALDFISELGDPYLDMVRDFIGLVLWLETDPQTGGAETLIASSFPGLPHCVVITDHATRTIAPSDTLPAPSPWALAESLYHESLHQVLSATILQDEIFVESFQAAAGPTIHAEWRNQDWPLDRSLHAMFVYAGLTQMRQRLLALGNLDGPEYEALARALSESSRAANLLGAKLDRHRGILTDQGNRLLSELQGDRIRSMPQRTIPDTRIME